MCIPCSLWNSMKRCSSRLGSFGGSLPMKVSPLGGDKRIKRPGIARCQSHLSWEHRDRCTSHRACSMASQVRELSPSSFSPVFTRFRPCSDPHLPWFSPANLKSPRTIFFTVLSLQPDTATPAVTWPRLEAKKKKHGKATRKTWMPVSSPRPS